jgi:hypothetical protein
MKTESTGGLGLFRSFDEARKSAREIAIRVRSWGAFNNNRLVHDVFAGLTKALHSERDDSERRISMMNAFAQRVAVVAKGTSDHSVIEEMKKEVLDSYDVNVEELDAFAADHCVHDYPGRKPVIC